MKRFLLVVFLAYLILIPLGVGHEEEVGVEPVKMGAEALKSQASLVLAITSVFILLIVIVALIYGKKKSETAKWVLFLAIAIPTLLATMYSAGSTIYINTVSETSGPVHWHADFEVWKCDEHLDLVNPTGLANRVGTAVLHEHGDQRLHVEGVLMDKQEANLENFFHLVGGEITDDLLVIHTVDGEVSMNNGDLCGEQPGELQVFVYRIKDAYASQSEDFVYEQIKVDHHYILSPYSNVPPGDCVIVEFGPTKETTDKICETYRVKMDQGEMTDGS